ncbi:MAG TPA: radical SAM protein [Candidatus Kapabacteria bacterium]|nr:radical SAM protein [Candidatus Kapabacteria bacterium]
MAALSEEYIPSYVALAKSGELQRRADALERMLESCDICPLDCKVNRIEGEIARCYSRHLPIVSSYCAHFGEEPALVGTHGVGNIFFGNCNLRCSYCQNFQISQRWKEEIKNEVSFERLAEIMLELQENNHCHAIGLVSPTHFVPQIVRSLELAAREGLRLPLIYNTNCYDSVNVLRLLDGIVDIYLPDFKYSDDETGLTYSKVEGYFTHASAALKEMYRQTGDDLIFGNDGLVKRGLIIRHLILPNDVAGSEKTFAFIARELSPRVTLSIMSQYYPTNIIDNSHAEKFDEIILLNRHIRASEYDRALRLMKTYGFENGWMQEFEAENYYRPDFTDRTVPFKDKKDFVAATE